MSITSFVKRIQDITRNDAGVNGDAQRIEQMSWLLFLKIYDSRELVWELEEDDYESIIPEDLKWRNWAHAEKGEQVLTGDDLLDFGVAQGTLYTVRDLLSDWRLGIINIPRDVLISFAEV